MKKILFILGLLMCALFMAPENLFHTEEDSMPLAQSEASMKEISQENDLQHKVAILSNDLKECNCLTPRRVFQTSSFSLDIRLLKHIEKENYTVRLKGMNILSKTNQTFSFINSSNISTLEHRMGRYVYSMRKLLI